MSKSRRRLSFVPASTAAAEGNTCALCQARHTQLSAPISWRNVEAQKLATELHLTDHSLVCRLCRDDVGRMEKKWNLGGKREREGRIAVFHCAATPHLHNQKLVVMRATWKTQHGPLLERVTLNLSQSTVAMQKKQTLGYGSTASTQNAGKS